MCQTSHWALGIHTEQVTHRSLPPHASKWMGEVHVHQIIRKQMCIPLFELESMSSRQDPAHPGQKGSGIREERHQTKSSRQGWQAWDEPGEWEVESG